jgi:predicted transcriptional regulator
MKAIIDIAPRGTVFDTATEQLATGVAADYHLHFESARLLFSNLTPSRVDLLDTLRRQGACSVYALARASGRNYSNVHSDVAAMESLGLIERDEMDAVFSPFDSIEVHLGATNAVAA